MNIEEIKTELEDLKDIIRELNNSYSNEIEINKKNYLRAYKLEDSQKLDWCLGYEQALKQIVVDLEELLNK